MRVRPGETPGQAGIGTWRSLVAHLTGGQGVAGSNPVVPTGDSCCSGSAPEESGADPDCFPGPPATRPEPPRPPGSGGPFPATGTLTRSILRNRLPRRRAVQHNQGQGQHAVRTGWPAPPVRGGCALKIFIGRCIGAMPRSSCWDPARSRTRIGCAASPRSWCPVVSCAACPRCCRVSWARQDEGSEEAGVRSAADPAGRVGAEGEESAPRRRDHPEDRAVGAGRVRSRRGPSGGRCVLRVGQTDRGVPAGRTGARPAGAERDGGGAALLDGGPAPRTGRCAVDPALQRTMGSRCTEVREWATGHSPFVGRPALLVSLLRELLVPGHRS